MHNIKKRTASKSIQVGMAKYSHLDLDGDNEIVVLASLNIPHEKCLGLNLSEESILSLKSRGSPNSSPREGVSKTASELVKLANRLEEINDTKFSPTRTIQEQLREIQKLKEIVAYEEPGKKYLRSKSAKVRFNESSETDSMKICKSESRITKSVKEHLSYREELDLLRNTFLGIFSDASNQWIDIDDEKEKPVPTKIVKVKSAKEHTKRSGKKKSQKTSRLSCSLIEQLSNYLICT